MIIEIIGHLLGEDKPFQLYLLGSRAKNIAVEGTDIDLAVSCSQLTEKVFGRMKRKIGNIRTLYSIDIIHLEKVDSHFMEIVLADANEIYG